MSLLLKSLFQVKIESFLHRKKKKYHHIGTHDSFAFHLTCHPAPNMNPNLKRFHIFIIPFIKSWSITQHLTIAGM